jgi:hypothetical protein
MFEDKMVNKVFDHIIDQMGTLIQLLMDIQIS